MKDNNIDKKLINLVHIIESKKNKYFFIGFITGILPFMILFYIISISSGNIPLIYKYTMIISALFTSFISSIYLGNRSYQVMKSLFEEKYDVQYNEIYKSIKMKCTHLSRH